MDMQGYYQMSGQAPSYIRPSKAEDWEPYRDIIAELYRTKKLKDVMEEMEAVYYFKATYVLTPRYLTCFSLSLSQSAARERQKSCSHLTGQTV